MMTPFKVCKQCGKDECVWIRRVGVQTQLDVCEKCFMDRERFK